MSDETELKSTAPANVRGKKWYDFRWRFLLLIPATAAVLVVIYAPKLIAQRKAIDRLKEVGAIVRTEPVAIPFVDAIVGKEYANNVTEVYLRNGNVDSEDLAALSGIGTISKMELSGSALSDDTAKQLRNLPGLYTLHLSDTGITDATLSHIADLGRLGVLSLGDNKITDSGLPHLSRLKNIERLFLNGTEITDEGLIHLSDLVTLKELDLSGTQVTEAGLPHLAKLKSLEMLKIPESAFSESAVAKLQESAQHCHVVTTAFRD